MGYTYIGFFHSIWSGWAIYSGHWMSSQDNVTCITSVKFSASITNLGLPVRCVCINTHYENKSIWSDFTKYIDALSKYASSREGKRHWILVE